MAGVKRSASLSTIRTMSTSPSSFDQRLTRGPRIVRPGYAQQTVEQERENGWVGAQKFWCPLWRASKGCPAPNQKQRQVDYAIKRAAFDN